MKHLLDVLFTEKHRLTARRRALGVLHELSKRRERLNLFVEGASRELPSLLLEVDEDAGCVVFDIPPAVDGVAWDEHEPLLAIARHDGLFVGFALEEIERIDWNGAVALQAQLPPRVYNLQRRHHFRVPVGSGDVSAVVLVRQGAAALNGRCHDLSAGGMRLLAQPRPGEIPLREGELLASVEFSLQGTALQVPGRVQNLGEAVRRADGSLVVPIGVEFTQKSPGFESFVARYVQERDRTLLAGR